MNSAWHPHPPGPATAAAISLAAVVLAGAASLTLAACSSGPRLADISTPALGLEISQAAGGDLLVRILPDRRDTKPTSGSRCDRPAPKAKATFNGAALKRLTGSYVGGEIQYDRDCLLEFAFPGPVLHEVQVGAHGATKKLARGMEVAGPVPDAARSPGPSVLRVEDPSATWTLEIPDAFTPRTMTLVAPADGILRRGQEAVIRWSPATDDLQRGDVGIRLRPAAAAPEEGISLRKTDVRGDRVRFVVPADAPRGWDGPVVLSFQGTANVRPSLGRCPVSRCTLGVTFSVPPLPARLAD